MNRRNLLFFSAFILTSTDIVNRLIKMYFLNSKVNSESMPKINSVPDLNYFFENEFSFQYDYQDGGIPPYTGLQTVTISVHEIGGLVVTSGKLIASDPLLQPDLRYYFTKTIPPGRYPVILSIAEFQPRNDARVAYAMLRLSDQPAVKWQVAKVNDQHPREDEGEIYGYGVDSGTGCFMDWDIAKDLYALANPDPIAYEAALQISHNLAWALSRAALDRFEREFCEPVIAAMEENRFKNRFSADWANIQLNDSTGGNVITFSSGWGDGGYSSYWGYDTEGKLASLVTDFVLFNTIEN